MFDGQLGHLDHALANYSMAAQVACLESWPVNADEIPVFDYNDIVRSTGEAAFEAEPGGDPLYEATAARTSDHDPIVVDVNLCPKRSARAAGCRLRTALAQLACLTSRVR